MIISFDFSFTHKLVNYQDWHTSNKSDHSALKNGVFRKRWNIKTKVNSSKKWKLQMKIEKHAVKFTDRNDHKNGIFYSEKFQVNRNSQNWKSWLQIEANIQFTTADNTKIRAQNSGLHPEINIHSRKHTKQPIGDWENRYKSVSHVSNEIKWQKWKLIHTDQVA